jgi:hypothetical protein
MNYRWHAFYLSLILALLAALPCRAQERAALAADRARSVGSLSLDP